MTPNPSYEVEQEADAFFRSKLNKRWLKREQRPDFYVDYLVEMDDEGGPSGEKFGVQLKGTRSPKYAQDSLSFKMKVKHLKYYVDKSPEPTFVVVVDVDEHRGFWLFLQEYMKRVDDEWREQQTFTVRIPITNSLDDVDSLRRAASKAVAYMRNMRPGSVGSAAAHLEESLESLDERFDVTVSYEDATTRVVLNPKVDVDGALHFKDANARQKFDELKASGKPGHFAAGEIHFTGSPIFAEMLARAGEAGVTLQTAKRIACRCSIFERGNGVAEKVVVPGMDGILVAGSREAELSITLEGSPITMRIAMSFTDESLLADMKFELSYVQEKWVGKELLLAPHFDRIAGLFSCMAAGERLGLDCEIDGNVMFKAAVTASEPDMVAQIDAILSVLGKARSVARHVGLRPRMPTLKTLVEAEQQILDLWSWTRDSPHVYEGVTGSGSAEFDDALVAKKRIEERELAGEATFDRKDLKPPPTLLGLPLNGWAVARIVTGLRLTKESRASLDAVAASGGGRVTVDIECSAESACYTSLERVNGRNAE